MKKFKLKNCVTHLFDADLGSRIEPIRFWKENHVSELALESINNPTITYGIMETPNSTSMCKWDGSSHFYFTLHVSDTTNAQHDIIRDKDVINGIIIRMNKSISTFLDGIL